MAGTLTTALRLIVGWTYFSAFWRRVVLENKLDPEVAGYIGEKFNHFLPNALFIQPLIEKLVTNPNQLHWAMILFTIVEAIVGLLLMLGLFTRLMSFGVFALAMGILLGSGWIGTTCLDEWQIGVLGLGAGFVLMLSGSGKFSLDGWLMKRSHDVLETKSWFRMLASGPLNISTKRLHAVVLAGSIGLFLLTLFTNQYFHGGVYGKLHNKSVRPKVEINSPQLNKNQLEFEVYRVEGADVYGSFLIGVDLKNDRDSTLFSINGEDLSALLPGQIDNRYVAKVKPGKHSLIIPLGAKATLQFKNPVFSSLPAGSYTLILTDISGIVWKKDFRY